MTSKHLVDPELAPLLAILPQTEFSTEGLRQTRAAMMQMMALGSAEPDGGAAVQRIERWVPGPSGAPDVRLLIHAPTAAAKHGAYLHIHGGGYVLGAPEMSEARHRLLVRELGCVVVSVDYRLAPETMFPGAVEDCYAALKWLHANAEALAVDRGRIAVGGESAGGGLAAALAILARDRGEVELIHQQLVYPMLDDRASAEPHPFTGEFAWREADNRFGWAALLGHTPGGEGVSPYAAAARAGDLAGLPPAFISVGALDLFLEQDLEYARRLTRAGVPVELHVYPGAFHGFDLAVESRLAKRHAGDQLEALRRALAFPAG